MGDLSETPLSLLSDPAYFADDVWDFVSTWHGDGNSRDSPTLRTSTTTTPHQRSYNNPPPTAHQNLNAHHPTSTPPQTVRVVPDPTHRAPNTRNESNAGLQSTPDELDFLSPSTPSIVSWNVLSSDSESDISPMNSQRLRQGRPPATPIHYTDTSQRTSSDFVDLTEDIHSPLQPRMPSASSHRGSNKRRRVDSNTSAPSPRGSQGRKTELRHDVPPAVEEVDLRDVEDDKGLSKVLEDQRMATIKAQQEQASRPVKLATLSCVICMEPMTNVTATYCGKSSSLYFQLARALTGLQAN